MDMNNLVNRFASQYGGNMPSFGGAMPVIEQGPSFGAAPVEMPIQPQEPTYSTPEGEFVGPKKPTREEMDFAKRQAEFKRMQEKFGFNEDGIIQEGKYAGERWYGPETKAWVREYGIENIRKKPELMQELEYKARNEARRYSGLAPIEMPMATPKENKPLPFDQASKLAAIESSYKQIQDLADSLFDSETGAFKRGDSAKSKIPGTPEARYNLKGQQALETWLRAMTGAAVTQDEMDRYTKMYLPQPWDDPDVALDKLERLQNQYMGTLENMGRGDRIDSNESRVAATKKRREAAQAARKAQDLQNTPELQAGRVKGTPGFNGGSSQPQAERPAIESFWR